MRRIKIGYASPNVGTAPVWTACDAGYFARRGLAVEPVLFEGSILTTAALERGEIELANYAAPAMIQARLERGSDLVIILGAMNRLMQALMGRSGVSSLEALRGGTIGVNEWGEVNHWLAKALLPLIGFQEGVDVTLVETGRARGQSWNVPRPADALIFHPPEPFAAIGAGWTLLADMRAWNAPFQLSCVAGRRGWIESHREEMELYLAGHFEGLLRFNRDRAFGLTTMRKWGPRVSEEAHQRTWDFASREFSERPFPTAEAIAGVLRAMAGVLPGATEADPLSFIDASLMEGLESSGTLAQLRASFEDEE